MAALTRKNSAAMLIPIVKGRFASKLTSSSGGSPRA
jgi:hypothetical protein